MAKTTKFEDLPVWLRERMLHLGRQVTTAGVSLLYFDRLPDATRQELVTPDAAYAKHRHALGLHMSLFPQQSQPEAIIRTAGRCNLVSIMEEEQLLMQLRDYGFLP